MPKWPNKYCIALKRDAPHHLQKGGGARKHGAPGPCKLPNITANSTEWADNVKGTAGEGKSSTPVAVSAVKGLGAGLSHRGPAFSSGAARCELISCIKCRTELVPPPPPLIQHYQAPGLEGAKDQGVHQPPYILPVCLSEHNNGFSGGIYQKTQADFLAHFEFSPTWEACFFLGTMSIQLDNMY